MTANFRKTFASFMTGAMVLSTVAFSFNVAVLTASAAAGDIIMAPGGDSVHVVLADGQSICRLVSEGHYDIWAQYRAKGLGRWQDVQTVDTSTFTDSGVCSLRTGALVRTAANPEVFVVQADGTKRGFDAWDTFVNLGYASGGVYFVTDEVLDTYTTGTKIDSTTTGTEIREGQLVKYAGDATVYYLADDGTGTITRRRVADEAAYWANFGVNWNLVLTVPDTETYGDGSDLTGADTSVNRPIAQGSITAPAGTVTFALASDTPSGALAPSKSYNNVFTKYNLTAGSDVTISSLTITRSGLGAATEFAAVYLVVDGIKFTTGRTFNSDDRALFSLGTGLKVKAGVPMDLDLVADMAAITSTGQHRLGLAAATDVTSDGTVSGSFPLLGNFVSTSTTAIGELVITSGSISDTELFFGEQEQELSRYNFTSGSAEKVRLNSIRFRHTGSADLATDYANFSLYKGGTKLTGTTTSIVGEYVTIGNINQTFEKSESGVLYKLFGDIVGGATSTVQFSIEEAADVNATGLSFGFGVTINNTSGATTWTEQKSHSSAVTILAGELTFAVTGPAAYSVDRKSDNVVAANLSIVAPAGETIEIRKMYAFLDGTDVDSDNSNNIEAAVENIQLIQTSGGVQVIDAVTSDSTANDDDSFYFSNIFVTGTTTWDLIFDTNDSNTQAGDTISFSMTADDDSATVGDNASVTPVDARSSDGKSLTSSSRDDIKPGAVVTGNNITFQDSSLTVNNVTLNNENAVAKQTGIEVIKLQIKAGTAGAVKITQMQFEDNAGTSDVEGSVDTANYSIYETDAAGSTETLLQAGKSASSATTDFTVTFNSLASGAGLTLQPDETKYILVKADFTSGIAAAEILSISATEDGVTAEKVSDGTALVDGDISGNDTAIAGRSVTAKASGQLTITIDETNATNAPTTQVLAGTTALNTMYLLFNADFEDVQLRTLKLDLVNTGANDSVVAVHLYDGTTLVKTGSYVQTDSEVTFGDGQTSFITLDKDLDKVLTVVTDLAAVGSGAGATADSGDEVRWRLDAETGPDTNDSIVGVGASSSSTLTYTTVRANSSVLFNSSDTGSSGQADDDIDSNIFHVRRALVSGITADTLPTTTLTNGTFEIFKFTVTAAGDTAGNQNDAIDFKDLQITLSATGITVASGTIHRTDAAGTSVSASTTSATAIAFLTEGGAGTGLSNLANIAPGTSATFVVKATLTGVGAGETLQAKISSLGAQSTEGTVTAFTSGDLIWSDNDDTVTDDETSWVSWPGITITDVVGPSLIAPSS